MIEWLKRVRRDLSKNYSFYFILIGFILGMSLTLHAEMRGADSRRYLRWTHSFVFDQDLHLLNDFEATGGSYKLTPTGYVFELANIGGPLLWTPFYGLASFFIPASTGPDSYPADTPIQLLWLNFSTWLYVILAGILTFAGMRRFFGSSVLLTALAAVLFGTPVLFYLVTSPMSVHPAQLLLAALVLFLWLVYQPEKSILFHLALGVTIGWLMMISTYNIVFFVLPGVSLLESLLHHKNLRQLLLNGLALGLGGLLGFGPQMIVYWFFFDNPFYSPYADQLLWSEPYLYGTLFSTFHSLFFYAPVLLLVIPGLWQLRRLDGLMALSVGLMWLLLTYIISINVAWWAGSSFGNRYFLTLTPFFVLGLAAFIQRYPRGAVFLILAGMLWTVGLYLQFLAGVRVTSDSVIYTAADLAAGQISAWTHAWNIVPQLWANPPWPTVSRWALPTFILILGAVSRWLYGWAMDNATKPAGHGLQRVIVVWGGIVILFIAMAGWRGNQTKAILVNQGFYDQPHEVVWREIKEVAGRAGLVTRAMYHEHMGQPDKVIADLRQASALWKSDAVPSPSRLYLGPNDDEVLQVPVSLHLDYPGHVRLIGYHILEANQNFIQGELFWEKQAGEKSRDVVTPIVRVFDPLGNNLGNFEIESPFPAEYIPAGSLFKDAFTLHLDTPAEAWVWLAVSLAEDPTAPPLNAQGQATGGIIGSVNVQAALVSGENSPGLIAQPVLLLNRAYQPGQTIPIQFVWQAPANVTPDTHLELTLHDSTGQVAVQQPYPFQPPRQASNPQPPTTYCLDLPTTLPPGDYRLTFALQPLQAGHWPDETLALPIRVALTGNDSPATICNLLEADFARRYEAPVPQHPIETRLTNQIKLVGYDLSIIPQAGSASARLLLYWRAQTHVTGDYQVSVQLLDATGQPVIAHTGIPDHGTRATSTWLRGEWILDEHVLKVPPLAPGNYQLSLALIDAQTDLAHQNVSGQPHLILQAIQIP